jgi:hypothetical protein
MGERFSLAWVGGLKTRKKEAQPAKKNREKATNRVHTSKSLNTRYNRRYTEGDKINSRRTVGRAGATKLGAYTLSGAEQQQNWLVVNEHQTT